MRATSQRHLILVGGGHAHLAVLRSFAERPEPGLRLTLVSPHPHATYSGMVPGVIAGRYRLDEAQIDLVAWARRASAAFVRGLVASVDPANRTVTPQQHPCLPYDVLSLDVGSVTPPFAGPPRIPIVDVKPVERAVQRIEEIVAGPAPASGHCAVVVGGGAAGCEIAFALAVRLAPAGGRVTVLERAPVPMRDRGLGASGLVLRCLQRAGIDFRGSSDVRTIDDAGVVLTNGDHLPATLVVRASGAAAPPFLVASGLSVDERGFVLVDAALRCVDHPEIFAAGDCATMLAHRTTPKAGVFAVRQGPVLAANLRALHRGESLEPFRPQRRFLSLLDTADGRAILIRGPIAWHGRVPGCLKTRIDRAFVRRYAASAAAGD